MENRLSVTALAGMVAEATGRSRKTTEDFIREFFRLVADVMADDGSVRIKGFGTFKVVDVDSRNGVNVNTGEKHEFGAHRKVTFTPSKEMAAFVNEPFEVFESMEMDDDISRYILEDEDTLTAGKEAIDEMNETDDITEGADEESNENDVADSILEAGSTEEGLDDEITYEAYTLAEEEESVPTPQQAAPETPAPQLYETPPTSENNMNVSTDKNVEMEPQVIYVDSPGKYAKGFFAGAMTSLSVCLIVFIIGCFCNGWPVNFGSAREEEKMETESAMEADAVVPIVEEQAPQEVIDTVTTTRYLTTIARDHYGNFNFWPYIYIENESKLGHPDRITPGTPVVVPPLSKYNIDPTSKIDEKEAKKKGYEIYARF